MFTSYLLDIILQINSSLAENRLLIPWSLIKDIRGQSAMYEMFSFRYKRV